MVPATYLINNLDYFFLFEFQVEIGDMKGLRFTLENILVRKTIGELDEINEGVEYSLICADAKLMHL